jgi:hypothetical protein
LNFERFAILWFPSGAGGVNPWQQVDVIDLKFLVESAALELTSTSKN